MKFIAIIGLIALIANENVMAEVEYVFDAVRGPIVVAPNSMASLIEYDDVILITYSQKITFENSIMLTGQVKHQNPDENVFTFSDLSTCDDPEILDSWDVVATQLFDSDFLPPRTEPMDYCTAAAGMYEIVQNAKKPIVTFDDEIECGDYILMLDANQNDQPILSVNYTFTIPDVGICT